MMAHLLDQVASITDIVHVNLCLSSRSLWHSQVYVTYTSPDLPAGFVMPKLINSINLLKTMFYKGINFKHCIEWFEHITVLCGVTQPAGAPVTFSGRGPLWFKNPFLSVVAPLPVGPPSLDAAATPSLHHWQYCQCTLYYIHASADNTACDDDNMMNVNWVMHHQQSLTLDRHPTTKNLSTEEEFLW